ncbi:MAG: FG-GAP repeat protein [Alphaproteobacteria bacterium]|nr:FG-GAP repeat protein [Alphaproteobacteria bacterium]MCB9794525.1 FG-GAP repeat protein [Alphaproteobacteria bacterium]
MLLPLLTLLACWPGALPDCPDCALHDDDDGDGFTPAQGDCDDGDAQVNPEATETCDGLDQDCDGVVDEDAADAEAWYADADGDGYGAGAASAVCDPGAGWSQVDQDCDDGDAQVNPSAEELCSNGVDDDCDGSDNGCVRLGERSLSQAERLWSAASANAHLGVLGLRVPDVNGDGRDELLVAAPDWGALNPGAVFLLPGPEGGGEGDVEADPRARLESSAANDSLGAALGVSEAHVAIQATGGLRDGSAGLVYLIDRDLSGVVDDPEAEAYARLRGRVAERLGALLDLSPEGALLLSSRESGLSAWYLEDVPAGQAQVDAIGHAILGDDTPSALALVDLDGDGAPELILGQDRADDGGRSEAGVISLLQGPVTADRDLDDAELTWTGPNRDDRAGGSLRRLPDLDGDGLEELLIAGPEGGGDSAWVLAGGGLQGGSLDDRAWLRAEGLAGAALGRAAAAGDLDGDGALELALGAPDDDRAGQGAGAVLVLQGPLSPGTWDLDDAALVLLGEGANHEAGAALDAGDFNGDGLDDLLIGAPGESSLSENGGGVYVWFGRGL